MLYRISQIILHFLEGKIFVSDYVFQFGWVVKTFKLNEIFYNNSFVFVSKGFDPKFVAFVAAW